MKWRNIENTYVERLEELKRLTPYELLEVDRSSSMVQIKKAYRKKISLYHPDRTDPFMKEYSEEVVKLLNIAIETLKKEHID